MLSFILFLIFSSPFVTAASSPKQYRKRQQWTPSDPQAFAVSLRQDAKGRYTTTVGMGRPTAQDFSFVISTTSPHLVVAGSGCSDCLAQTGAASSTYDGSKSTSDVALSSNTSFALGSGVASGSTIAEDCNLKQANGSDWWYKNQTVIVADQSSGIFGNGASGVLGFGRSSGKDSLIDSIFRSHPKWENFTVGFALKHAGIDPNDTGVIHIKELDDSCYEGDLNANAVVAVEDNWPANMPRDWAIRMDSWSVDVDGSVVTASSGKIAIVDPYFPEIRLPQEDATVFYAKVPESSQVADESGLSWTFRCDQKLSFTATFNGVPYKIDADRLILSDTADNGRCFGAVKAWQDKSVNSYLLGSAFAETVYIAFSANRNGTADTVGIAPRAPGRYDMSGDHLSKGAIAGVSTGAVVGGLILLALLALYLRQRRAEQVMSPISEASHKAKYKVEPWKPTPRANGTIVNGRPQTTPWIIEQGPIGGDIGATAGLLSNRSPDATPTTMGLLHTPSGHSKAMEASESTHVDARASTTTSSTDLLRALSMTSQTPSHPGSPQIHYHIHVSQHPGGNLPATFSSVGAPPSEYPEDQLPQYEERSPPATDLPQSVSDQSSRHSGHHPQ